jgi:hypothetical protein
MGEQLTDTHPMDDFERGVRYVIEHIETYTLGTGPEALQFGDYVMSMEPRPASALLPGSAEHRERRVQAMLTIARGEKTDGPVR